MGVCRVTPGNLLQPFLGQGVERMDSLMDRSLYEIACEGRHQEVRETVTSMFDLRRIQP